MDCCAFFQVWSTSRRVTQEKGREKKWRACEDKKARTKGRGRSFFLLSCPRARFDFFHSRLFSPLSKRSQEKGGLHINLHSTWVVDSFLVQSLHTTILCAVRMMYREQDLPWTCPLTNRTISFRTVFLTSLECDCALVLNYLLFLKDLRFKHIIGVLLIKVELGTW